MWPRPCQKCQHFVQICFIFISFKLGSDKARLPMQLCLEYEICLILIIFVITALEKKSKFCENFFSPIYSNYVQILSSDRAMVTKLIKLWQISKILYSYSQHTGTLCPSDCLPCWSWLLQLWNLEITFLMWFSVLIFC